MNRTHLTCQASPTWTANCAAQDLINTAQAGQILVQAEVFVKTLWFWFADALAEVRHLV